MLAAPGFDASRLRAASGGAEVLTGDARGRAEYPELLQARTELIAVTASFGGLALFIAIFVVASTMGLSIQQREREIALLRAVAATPGQIRRMISWEAAIVGLVGSAAGIWPGAVLGRELAEGLVRHGIAPPNLTVSAGWLPIAAAVGGGVVAALLAVLAAGRRAARVPPTHALTEAAVEPRLLGPGRVIGGLLALAGAVPLFAVATTTSAPDTAAATSEMTALFLVAAVGFLGPIVARLAAGVLGPPLARLSPVGGFLASANLRTATRRFSSASTPLMLTVGLSCTLLFSSTTIDHAVTQQRQAGLTGELAITSTGPGLPAAALADVRATPGVRSAVALTPTTLGPSLGRLRRRRPRADPQRGAGRRTRRRRDRRIAGGAARRHDRARAPARRRRARPDRRPRAGHARRRDPHARHRRGDLHAARWGSATPCSHPSSRPATRRARCSGRSSCRPATRPPSPGACGHWPRGIRGCG